MKVEFRKSGKVVEWQDRFESILELAEDQGIQIPFECRQGFCGECKVKMISGEVHMEETQGLENGDETEQRDSALRRYSHYGCHPGILGGLLGEP